jgi:hypothetical protein
MSTKTCATCKHYGVITAVHESLVHELSTGAPEYEYKELPHRKCSAILQGHKLFFDEAKDKPALAFDGEAYYAAVWTLPTFSCALWEKKP